jgi:hypothetical protein
MKAREAFPHGDPEWGRPKVTLVASKADAETRGRAVIVTAELELGAGSLFRLRFDFQIDGNATEAFVRNRAMHEATMILPEILDHIEGLILGFEAEETIEQVWATEWMSK